MTIAIILSAHGSVSEQFLYTTEMIIGKQHNITWVNLLPSENIDNLCEKYQNSLSQLSINSGVLFLVDIWGGTPFNAAQKIIFDKKNYDIITGMNIPMLIEILLVRDKIQSIEKLVQLALQSGSESIKSVKFSTTTISQIRYNKYPSNNDDSQKFAVKNTKLKEKHMTISLARIDDRLIHGQVVTRWAKELNINRIIVINNDIVKDTIRKNLLTQVTPPGITAHVIDIQKAIRVYNNPKYANDKVIMLFTNPADIIPIIKNGVPIKSINIGGMSYNKNKKQIHNAISVSTEDIKAFKELDQIGIKLEVRKVPSDSPIKLMMLISNIIQ